MSQNYCIYKHTSPSGKSYIGQTNQYAKRNHQHRSSRSRCRLFSKAISKYGWDNFSHEIIKDNLTLEEANFWEVFYILEYGSLSPCGYNLHTGGLHSKPSEETREKLRKASSGNTYNLGKKHSEETKLKMSLAAKGKPKNPEAIEKMRQYRIGRKASDQAKANMSNAQKGKILSSEQKEKIRAANIGRVFSEETKKKIGDKAIGRIVTEETKKKLSEAGKRRVLTDSEKEKISYAKKKRFEIALSEATEKQRHIMLRNKRHRDKSRSKAKLNKELCI